MIQTIVDNNISIFRIRIYPAAAKIQYKLLHCTLFLEKMLLFARKKYVLAEKVLKALEFSSIDVVVQ